MKVSKYLVNNLNVHHIETKKFKTILLGIVFTAPLTTKYLAEKILLSIMLTKTCASFPKEQDYLKFLRGMYDTNIFGDVSKRGKTLKIMFAANIVNPKYLEEDVELVDFTVNALHNTLINPYLENGDFSEELLKKEKALLIDDIKSQNNNPRIMAVGGLIRNMFKGETYELYAGLTQEEVELVTTTSLKKAYEDLLSSSAYALAIGDISKEQCQKSFGRFQKFNSYKNNLEYIDYETKIIVESQEIIVEKPTNQSVLTMGFRTDIRLYEPNNYPMNIMNGMFGGFFHSTLTQVIREKLGLAYYIQSEYIPQKGFMVITAGINATDYEKVKKIILDILKDFQSGNILEQNLMMTKEILISTLLENDDLLIGLLNDIYRFVEQQNARKSLEEKIELIKKVTKKEIVDVSNTLVLDTIFFLKGTINDEEV